MPKGGKGKGKGRKGARGPEAGAAAAAAEAAALTSASPSRNNMALEAIATVLFHCPSFRSKFDLREADRDGTDLSLACVFRTIGRLP